MVELEGRDEFEDRDGPVLLLLLLLLPLPPPEEGFDVPLGVLLDEVDDETVTTLKTSP